MMGWGTPSLRPHQTTMEGWLRKRWMVSRRWRGRARVFGLDVVVLGGLPEIVPDHHAVLVGELVEGFFGALADPVADDVEVGVAVEAEERLEALAGDALAEVVHAPVAAARGDAHAIDAEDEIGCGAQVVERLDGGRVFRAGRERGDVRAGIGATFLRRMAGGSAVGGGNLRMPSWLTSTMGAGGLRLRALAGVILDAAQMAGAVEQAEFVADLADAEADVFACRRRRRRMKRELQRVELRACRSRWATTDAGAARLS